MQRQFNLPENREALGEEDLSPLNQYLINTMDWIVTQRNELDAEKIQACRDEVEYRLKPYVDRIFSHKQQMEDSGINMPRAGTQTTELGEIEELMDDLIKQ